MRQFQARFSPGCGLVAVLRRSGAFDSRSASAAMTTFSSRSLAAREYSDEFWG